MSTELIKFLTLASGAVAVCFAALAVFLLRSKGNTMKDILNSPAYRDKPPEALRVEVEKFNRKFHMSTQLPVVALFVIALACALALPAAAMYLNYRRKQQSELTGRCPRNVLTINSAIANQQREGIFVVYDEFEVKRSGAFQLMLNKDRTQERYQIYSTHYEPVTMTLRYDSSNHTIHARLVGAELEESVRVESEDQPVEIGPIRLPPVAEPPPEDAGPAAVAPGATGSHAAMRESREREEPVEMRTDFLGGEQ